MTISTNCYFLVEIIIQIFFLNHFFTMPVIISKLMPTNLEVNTLSRECCTVDVKVVLTQPPSSCRQAIVIPSHRNTLLPVAMQLKGRRTHFGCMSLMLELPIRKGDF